MLPEYSNVYAPLLLSPTAPFPFLREEEIQTTTAVQTQYGISNYLRHDVQNIHDIQAAAESVLPTVF